MNRFAALILAVALGVGPWAPLVAGDAPANADPSPKKSPMAGPPPMVHEHVPAFYDPATDTVFNHVFFAPGSAELSLEAKDILNMQAVELVSLGGPGVVIRGFTTRTEVNSANEALALGARRAQAVKEYIVSRGVRGDILQVKSWGWRQVHRSPDKNRVAVTVMQ